MLVELCTSELVHASLAAVPGDGFALMAVTGSGRSGAVCAVPVVLILACRSFATIELLDSIEVLDVFRKDLAFETGVTE